MVGLPGKAFRANPTATGHIPVYKANGMLSYLVTLATLCALVATDRYSKKLLPLGASRRREKMQTVFVAAAAVS